MLNVAFDAVKRDRKNLQSRINKQEGLQLARQEKNDLETENANATYQKKFDEQMDLLIKQIETKRMNGDPEEAKVSEIFAETGQDYRAEAEKAIAEEIVETAKKVTEAKEELNLKHLTNKEHRLVHQQMNDIASALRQNMKVQNSSWVENNLDPMGVRFSSSLASELFSFQKSHTRYFDKEETKNKLEKAHGIESKMTDLCRAKEDKDL